MEMVVLGIGEEARPKACSSAIGSAKQQHDDSGEKTLADDSTQENGVRVSGNGEQKVLGDLDDDNKAKENVVVETENLNDSGVIEDYVMNGVSSLLNLKQDVSDKDNNLQEEKEIGDDEAEDEGVEEHGYYVGDFVWGKIKNHPWWPGQIYDASDASDLALKIKQKGKLLVAYFGDETFAWCCPSQLKPFAESFSECSKISNSRGFLGAVEEAVEEMGRHIERLLLCDCAEEKDKLDSFKAKNAGIKEGVVVRDVRREMISSLLVGKPEGILKDVKGFAETVSFSGLLELEILKRKVSAFYRSKRGYGLTEYLEPQSVPGLEDKNNDDDDEDEFTDDEINWRRSGARRSIKEKEDREEVLNPEESLPRSLEMCSGFPDHRLQHRRKQKSIAEILENESAAKVRFETEPADGNVKSSRKKVKRRDEVKGELANVSTITPRRSRMSKMSTTEDTDRNKVEENDEGKTLSSKMNKRYVDDNDASENRDVSAHVEEIEKNEVSYPEIDIDSTLLASLRKKVRVDASSVERDSGNGETATQTPKRERKKSKYLSPDYLSDFSSKGRKKSKIESKSSKISSQNRVGEHMTDASDNLVAMEENKLDIPCEPSLDNGTGHQELSVELSIAVDFLRLGATAEEMRDLIRVTALGTHDPKDSSSMDMVREFMSIYRSFTYHDGANNRFLRSYNSSDKDIEELIATGKPESKGEESKCKKPEVKQQTQDIEQIGKVENETTKKERKPKNPKSKKQGDEEEETRKELSETTKKERKRKNTESKKQADEEEETLEELNESKKKDRKRKKPMFEEVQTGNETENPENKKKRERKSKKQKVGEKKVETEKGFSGAELFVSFGPGSNLPKKEELIEIYEKFGALDEERTNMFVNNFCARVAFLNVADGEKAFESSQEKCPFASVFTVKFRLKYPNERSKEAEVEEATMELEYVKKKLEEMRSLVDECEGGMTKEMKVKLEDEMVNFLKKVRKMRSS